MPSVKMFFILSTFLHLNSITKLFKPIIIIMTGSADVYVLCGNVPIQETSLEVFNFFNWEFEIGEFTLVGWWRRQPRQFEPPELKFKSHLHFDLAAAWGGTQLKSEYFETAGMEEPILVFFLISGFCSSGIFWKSTLDFNIQIWILKSSVGGTLRRHMRAPHLKSE